MTAAVSLRQTALAYVETAIDAASGSSSQNIACKLQPHLYSE